MCNVCKFLDSHKLLVRNQYCIVNDNEILKCILEAHAENPKGCINCIKGYMKETLFLFAQRYYDHSRFTVQEVPGEHLYYQVVMR